MAKPVSALDYVAKPDKYPPQQFCVLFGDEPFLKRLALAEIRQRVLGGIASEGDFSYTALSGEKSDKLEMRTVVDELTMVAMFGSGKRMVVVHEADEFVSANRQKLEDLVARPRGRGVLVLEVKTWPATTKLYKAIAEVGLQVDCKAPSEKELLGWLPVWAKSHHQAELASSAAGRMMEIIGPEMGLLDQELAKLALLVKPGEKIDVKLVEDVVGGWRAKTAWDMIDAAADGNARVALQQLDRLLTAGEAPIALLGQFNSTLRRLATARRVMDDAQVTGRKMDTTSALGIGGVNTNWSAAKEKAQRQFNQLGAARGRQLRRWLLEADLALKGASSGPARGRLVLEQLILRMAAQLNEPKSALRKPLRTS